jgi:predicted nuclease of predicted toxin-antitoxin system
MRLKLDENLGVRTRQLFRDAGHEVKTVLEQGLGGTSDQHLYEVCRDEKMGLVTLDLDFADVLRFPPDTSAGIAVIRVPQNPSLSVLQRLAAQLVQAINSQSLEGQLWIVEVGRIRMYQSGSTE